MIDEAKLKIWAEVEYDMRKSNIKFANTRIENPAITFSNQAKAGKFNDLSDAEYEEALHTVKSQANIWRQHEALTADALVTHVVHFLPTEEAISAIVDIAKKVIEDNTPTPLRDNVGLFDAPWDEIAAKYAAEPKVVDTNAMDKETIASGDTYDVDNSELVVFDKKTLDKFYKTIARRTGIKPTDEGFEDLRDTILNHAIDRYLDPFVDYDKKKSKKGKGDKK